MNYVTADITDCDLIDNPLERPEHMRLKLSEVSDWALAHFNFARYVQPGADTVLLQVVYGIYGLPQSGLLAQRRLKVHLADHGYAESQLTPCHFTHIPGPIEFLLVVDDLGISTEGDGPALRQFDVLQKRCPLKVDMTGSKFIGFQVEFEYVSKAADRGCRISIPGSVAAALTRFCVVHPNVFPAGRNCVVYPGLS